MPVCVSASALVKWRSKRKNVLTAVVEGCKAGWLESPLAIAADSDIDAEAYVSYCSDVSSVITASQKSYPEKKFQAVPSVN